MSTAPPTGPIAGLTHQFADTVPDLAVPWRAAPVGDPTVLVLDDAVARDLGLDPERLRTPAGLAFLAGQEAGLAGTGARPVAQVYAGHQFGGYSPRLGDGRALLLGELTTPAGELRDLHLKGSGATPLSRGGDGLAAVGPMLREHLVSTALHAMGVPTTRALAVLATGGTVQRDTPLPGALLVRTARSHLRVGSAQYARALAGGEPDAQSLQPLAHLVALALLRHYPDDVDTPTPALTLLTRVCEAQARLVAAWMGIGFIHGVLNTDNVLLSGESIDFGPCAFLEAFDPATVYSSIDHDGRYAWGRQPEITEWNLARLAEALLPLIDRDQPAAIEAATQALGTFRHTYGPAWQDGLLRKLGLADAPTRVPGEQLTSLVTGLLDLMRAERVDLTGFHRALSDAARGRPEGVRDQVLDRERLDAWLAQWQALGPDPEAMDRVNPLYVPRNRQTQEALDAADAGDLGPYERLLAAVRDPFTERPGLEYYTEPAPEAFAAGFRTFCGT
ncbi:YdiU family protein [Nocardioides sp.]|uniref:protein adenylyltransferase SelO n=1 Tax=Nocardioides sp. TaxID=35761 RepID=UPI00351113B7